MKKIILTIATVALMASVSSCCCNNTKEEKKCECTEECCKDGECKECTGECQAAAEVAAQE